MEISAHASRQLVQALQSQSTALVSLKPGDTVAAQVLGRSPSGGTLLSLAGGQISVSLPTAPSLGTVLNLQVQSTANGVQFSIVSQVAPQAGNPANAAALPLAQGQTAQATPAQSPAVQNSISPQALSTSATISQPLATQASNPNLFTNLQAGSVITAQVIGAAPNAQTLIAVGGQQIAVTLPGAPLPGNTLTLNVQSGPQGLQLAAGSSASANATLVASNTAQPPPVLAAPVTAPSAAQVLSQSAIAALGNQNSVSTLISSVLRLGGKSSDLPQPVQETIANLKNSAITLSTQSPSAEALKSAVTRSGTFFEASLAGRGGISAGGAATPSGALPSTPSIQGDLKAILFLLKGTLSKWLGEGSSSTANSRPPHPPEKGGSPRVGQLENYSTPTQASTAQIGQSLLTKTDAALSRLHLLQLASMPDAEVPHALPKAEWQVELPFTLGQDVGTLNMHIIRDEHEPGTDEGERGWEVRFALNVGKIGEVGAEVRFVAGNTGVVLWAERPETVELLEASLPDLSAGLSAQGLTVGTIRVRRATSDTPPAPNGPPNTGQYVDIGT